MIIPGNALLALLNPLQESQGTSEAESGFRTLLTAIQQHTTSLPDQETTERRALESVLQALMSIFQSCTPANLLPAAAAPGKGESDPVRIQPSGGGSLGLPPVIVSDGSQNIGPLTIPVAVGQSTAPSPATAGALENFSWLLHRQESMQNLSGIVMPQPTAGSETPLSATSADTPSSASGDSVLATAETQFVSPGRLQASLATTPPLPPGASSPTFLDLHASSPSQPSPARGEGEKGPAVAVEEQAWAKSSPIGEDRGEFVSQRVSAERGEGPPLMRRPSADAVAGNGPDGPAPMPLRQGWDEVEARQPLAATPAAARLPQSDVGQPAALAPTPPLGGSAHAAPSLGPEAEVGPSLHSTAPSAPGAGPATVPLPTEGVVPPPVAPLTEAAAASAALQLSALGPDDTMHNGTASLLTAGQRRPDALTPADPVLTAEEAEHAPPPRPASSAQAPGPVSRAASATPNAALPRVTAPLPAGPQPGAAAPAASSTPTGAPQPAGAQPPGHSVPAAPLPGAFPAAQSDVGQPAALAPTPPLGGSAHAAPSLEPEAEVGPSPRPMALSAPEPAAPGAGPAPVPLTAATVPLATVQPPEAVVASAARRPGTFAPADPVLAAEETRRDAHALPENSAQAPGPVSSTAPVTPDAALPVAAPHAQASLPAAEPSLAVPAPSHTLEDIARQWPRPLPPNMVLLHLEPRELGTLLLQVRVNDKRLIASFQAQSPEAETLLRAHLPSLHESLSQHGFEVQPIAITRAAEGFSMHMDAGAGAFAHQHSAFQAFAEERQAANTGETQSEIDIQRTPRWPSAQRPRLLDVVI